MFKGRFGGRSSPVTLGVEEQRYFYMSTCLARQLYVEVRILDRGMSLLTRRDCPVFGDPSSVPGKLGDGIGNLEAMGVALCWKCNKMLSTQC